MKTLTAVLVLAAAVPALADPPQLVLEPTPAMVVVHPGNPHPVSVAAASGMFAGLDFFPTTLLGQSLHVLSVGGDLFGSLTAAQQLAGYAALGLQVVLYEAITMMVSLDMYDANSKTGVFAGTLSGANVAIGLGVDLMLLTRLLPLHQAPASLPAAASP